MKPAEPSPSWLIALFPQSYVPVVLQDILDALPRLKTPPEEATRPEEHLTGQLYSIVKGNARYYSGPLEPSIEHWLPDQESRVDIRFSCGKGQETYFVVEAKRLFTTYPGGARADLLQPYIDEGMMRFIGGRYAPYQQASAMLAYVFDVTCAEARCAVKTAVEKRRRDLRLTGDFGPSALVVTPPVDETKHALRAKTFTLYHLFAQLSPRHEAKRTAGKRNPSKAHLPLYAAK
ncbi:MAG: hypothetical protein FJ276_01910 [Planctomycetes bacterium]|nr:hypothetical protein [Planctomycetota bacterium]